MQILPGQELPGAVSSSEPDLLGIEPVLKDHDGRDLIDDSLAFRPRRVALGIQQLMRGVRGEPLVPQVHRQHRVLAKSLGKLLHPLALWADFAGHVQRIADNNGLDAMLAQEASNVTHFLAEMRAPKGQQRTRDAERVRERNAHAAIAHIQAQDTRLLMHLISIDGTHRASAFRNSQHLQLADHFQAHVRQALIHHSDFPRGSRG